MTTPTEDLEYEASLFVDEDDEKLLDFLMTPTSQPGKTQLEIATRRHKVMQYTIPNKKIEFLSRLVPKRENYKKVSRPTSTEIPIYQCSPSASTYHKGQKVSHAQFGKGVIQHIFFVKQNQAVLQVQFDRIGKRLVDEITVKKR